MTSYQDFIKTIQRKGLLVFSKENTLHNIDTHEGSLKVTLARNVRLGNIIYLGQGLYSLIPPEYKVMGAPPCEWVIDDLMKAHECHYYAGLLTAAAFYGAAHQAPQIFQIICDKRIPKVLIGKTRIHFYYSKEIATLPFQTKNTPTGTIKISTPEVTAFDLIKYMQQSGHMNHVATVLLELGESLKARELKKVSSYYPLSISQRLGYMLDELGYSHKTSLLNTTINKQTLRYIPLRSDMPPGAFPKNEKWHIIVNEQLEPDDI
ncbi:MAG: hypothetical protein ACD_16C00001G0008 [uncultured bacterium]|nr:MAG: hypothetical protein ACD_16C00001G0008 [uncultured bacterium]OFW74542.1 MAG: hypothetical protein A2Z80_00530 [Alphaproteobacteria bacterium GWA2_41_27]OFW84615.1 MAG: hypothetical protein A2W06_07570 [Alphaproteobacteria bacterium RBG_16_42_14]OFW84624.1 MAG: hypothetical protein A3E50_06660 [Alphaproteobacteria bacterium RIFCSPHIGHO2_12_FULL_42_100]OFW92625.1 MAG: hypothetical protein A2W46_06490 [Alphaproteobacteria bacterium RIFCSPHIGHO2_12_42_13]OFW92645.1 MAG: hypothetical protei